MGLIQVHDPGLLDHGPRLKLRLAPCASARRAMERAGKTVPPPLEFDALMDTGSSRSILQEDLVQKLKVFPVGTARMSTALRSGALTYEYLLNVGLEDIHFEAVFIGALLPDPDVQVLLGRDVLSHGIFHYDGRDSSFTFEI